MSKHRRNGFWIGLFCAFLVFAFYCTNTGRAGADEDPNVNPDKQSQDEPAVEQNEPTEDSPDASTEPLWLKTVKEDMDGWTDRLIRDTKESFLRPDNATALLLAGAASVVMHQDADKDIADYFERHQKLRNFRDESLNIAGHPTTHFAASTLWYYLCIRNDDDVNRGRAWTMRTALTINWLATMGLKAARNNETPNGKDWAWPSGHTSSSFTVASVLDEFYGPKVGIPAYAVASLVAYRMVDTDDHWASDVVFGATLGWIVGHTVAGNHKEFEMAGFKIVPFVPVTEEPTIGIGFVKRF